MTSTPIQYHPSILVGIEGDIWFSEPEDSTTAALIRSMTTLRFSQNRQSDEIPYIRIGNLPPIKYVVDVIPSEYGEGLLLVLTRRNQLLAIRQEGQQDIMPGIIDIFKTVNGSYVYLTANREVRLVDDLVNNQSQSTLIRSDASSIHPLKLRHDNTIDGVLIRHPQGDDIYSLIDEPFLLKTHRLINPIKINFNNIVLNNSIIYLSYDRDRLIENIININGASDATTIETYGLSVALINDQLRSNSVDNPILATDVSKIIHFISAADYPRYQQDGVVIVSRDGTTYNLNYWNKTIDNLEIPVILSA